MCTPIPDPAASLPMSLASLDPVRSSLHHRPFGRASADATSNGVDFLHWTIIMMLNPARGFKIAIYGLLSVPQRYAR